MTSKTGLPINRAAVRQAFSKCKYLALAGGVGIVVLQLNSLMGYMAGISGRSADLLTNALFLDEMFLLYFPFIQAAFSLAVAALCFGFLFSRQHAHCQLALPIRREALFTSRFIAGAVCSLAPLAAAALVNLVCNAIQGFGEFIRISYIFRMLGGLALQALLCYSISVFACLKSGSIVKAITTGAALLSAPSLIFMGADRLMMLYLTGYGRPRAYFTSANGLNIHPYFSFSPVTFFLEKSVDLNVFAMTREWEGVSFTALDTVIPIAALILFAGLFFMGYKCFSRYPAQDAGQPEIGRRFARWLPAALSLGISGIFLSFAFINDRPVWNRTLNFLLLGIGTTIGLYVLLAFAFHLWERKISRWLPSLLCASLLPVALIGILTFGFPNYAAAAPELSEISSVAISYRGLRSVAEIENNGRGSSGGVFNEHSGELLLTSPEDIEIAIEIQKRLADSPKTRSGQGVTYNQVDIIYTLRDGGKVSRRFWRMDADAYLAMLELDETRAFDDAVRWYLGLPSDPASMREGADFRGTLSSITLTTDAPVYLRMPDGTKVSFDLDADQRAELAEIFYGEFSGQTADQRYFPEEREAATLVIEYGGNDWMRTDSDYEYDTFSLGLNIALYADQFSETLVFLEAVGEFPAEDADFVRASYITAMDYLTKSALVKWNLSPAVFYAIGGTGGRVPDTGGSLDAYLKETVDGGVIRSLYEISTTQTSYARDGYMVWFFRADGRYICRFVEKSAFEKIL